MKSIFMTVLWLTTAALGAQTLPDGGKVLAEIDQIRFPENFTMNITMTTAAPGETDKVMTMESTRKKGFGSYIEVQAPARSKGTRFLTQEGSLWMFNPKSGSTKPLRLANKDSFQGSTFSNSDVSRTAFTEDYKGVMEAEETVQHPEFGTVKAWKLRAEATTPEAAYSKIVMWVRQGDLVPLRFEYYAKSGLLFRTMVLSQYKTLAGRLRATHMEMTSMDRAGTKSILTINAMAVKNDIPDSLYNLNNLTR